MGGSIVFCNNCGTENPDDVKFCSNCGTALKSISDEAAAIFDKARKREIAAEPKKRGFWNSIGTALAWIFGIVYTLGGVVLVSESIIGGLLTAAGGLILIPATRNYIAKTRNINISGWAGFAIFFVLVLAGVSFAPSSTNAPNTDTTYADESTAQTRPTQDTKLITKSEEEMLLTIDDMPLGWTGSNGAVKYIQSGDFRSVESEVTKYSSVDEAKEAYQNLIPENVATTSVNFGDEGVGYTKTMGLWTCIIFRKDNVIVEIRGFSEYHTIDMTDIKMLAMAVEKKM